MRPWEPCNAACAWLIVGDMKYLIVDDHAVLRGGMKALLAQCVADVVVLEAADGDEALRVIADHADLDAVLLDLEMPGMGGFAAIEAFGRQRPNLPVIVLSSSEDPQQVRRALASGALGYVPKSANPKVLLSALQLVLEGNVYVPPLMLNEMPAAKPQAPGPSAPTPIDRLTERQVEVLRLIARGLSNKEIGSLLGLSEKTVKVHVTGIFKVLNVVNRTQAASAARDLNMI